MSTDNPSPPGGLKKSRGDDPLPGRSRASGYLVLARRYRPTQFDQLIGQSHVTRTLQNAIVAGRVHHAYLFTGCRGVGKTTVARIMAKALNCDQGPTPTPCDACPSCLEIPDGRAVDVFEIDGASHTGVDDVRELRESVRYLPTRNRHKIFIIDEVHMLSTSAFNALLKTLEEPPAHVVFIFATTEPHKIPATIHSRCQRFDFKRVTQSVLVQHLQSLCQRESVQIASGGLSLIARASEGSVRDALSLLDQVIAYHAGEEGISAEKVAEVLGVADRRVLFDFSGAILRREAQQALEVVDRLFESGHDLSQFAHAFLAHLRDLAVTRTCQDPLPLLDATEAELEQLRQQADGEQGALLPQHFDHFARVTEEIARSSYPRLLLEMAVVEMVNAEPLLPLGDLLQRLEHLESRLTGGGGPGPGPAPRRAPSRSVQPAPRKEPRTAAPHTAAPRTTQPRATQPRATQPRATQPRNTARRREAPPSPGTDGPAAPPDSAAPESVAPPPGNGQGLEAWQQLLEKVMQQEPVAASAFAAGSLVSWEQDTVVLGYAQDSFELGWARDPKKLEDFAGACSQQAGRRLSVQIREIRPDEPQSQQVMQASAFREQARKQADRARSLREEAQSHPITRALVDGFGATIDSITTEVDES